MAGKPANEPGRVVYFHSSVAGWCVNCEVVFKMNGHRACPICASESSWMMLSRVVNREGRVRTAVKAIEALREALGE